MTRPRRVPHSYVMTVSPMPRARIPQTSAHLDLMQGRHHILVERRCCHGADYNQCLRGRSSNALISRQIELGPLATASAACKNRCAKLDRRRCCMEAAKGTRILKLVGALLLPLLVLVALALPRNRTMLWAQLPPPNPNLAPATTPSGVPSLSQPAATIGIPTLAIIRTPVATATTTGPRVFNCSCFGPGSGTHFVGRVSATGYFAARQGAISACLSFNQTREPASAFNYASSFAGAAIATPAMAGANLPPDAAAAPTLPGTLNFSSSAQLRMCSQCTCN